MPAFHARTVFFIRDAGRSLDFYTNTLGFALDWKHEVEPDTRDRPGHGRVFIGLEKEQADAFQRHVESRRIQTTTTYWGAPTVAIRDLDQNEIFFWLPEAERNKTTP